jgi:hypothetical protein
MGTVACCCPCQFHHLSGGIYAGLGTRAGRGMAGCCSFRLPDCEAADARASLQRWYQASTASRARRVGASAVHRSVATGVHEHHEEEL